MEEVPVTLVSIGGGAAVELFDIELERVLANIKDINTDPKTRRRITLVVDIVPNEERAYGDVRITATSKLASGKAHQSLMYVVKRGGQIMAVESNPQQLNIPGDVVSIGGGERKQ
jgi:hypothetical protein